MSGTLHAKSPPGTLKNARDARNAWKIAYRRLWSASEDSHLVRNYILLKYRFEIAYEIQKPNCIHAMQSLYWTLVCCVWWISCSLICFLIKLSVYYYIKLQNIYAEHMEKVFMLNKYKVASLHMLWVISRNLSVSAIYQRTSMQSCEP